MLENNYYESFRIKWHLKSEQLIAIVNGTLTWLVKSSQVEQWMPAKAATKKGQIKYTARFKPMSTMDCNTYAVKFLQTIIFVER